MYNEGIIDFKPLGNTRTANKNFPTKGTPTLKSDPGAYGYFMHDGTHTSFRRTSCVKGVEGCDYGCGMSYVGNIKELIYFTRYPYATATKGFDSKLLKGVDEKLDDGWYSTGVFRGSCYGSNGRGYNSYENATENGKKCESFYYAL